MSAAAEARAHPTFPPLFRGMEAPAGLDPMRKAVAEAAIGTEAGLVVWRIAPERLEAALVLAPEAPLERAVSVAFAAQLGLGDALGALGPPELALHYDWPDGLVVNGARAGRFRMAAATDDPGAEPDWLVLGIEIGLGPGDAEPGLAPDRTSLLEEGCGDVTPERLLESWSRHMLVWINTWVEDGFAPLHEAWRGRARGLGETGPDGRTFLGLDEHGGRLSRGADGATTLTPLTDRLEAA